MRSRIIAGAMSGTSADGVDVALVEIAGRGIEMTVRLLSHHHYSYADDLKRTLFAARESGSASLHDLAKCAEEIAACYARAVGETFLLAGVESRDVEAIAAHGQTLYHDPPRTIQWIDPALLAARAGCTVVSDFRRADCAAGGQGAPLVPFADYILFRDARTSRAVINIGGIANVTLIPAGASLEQIRAFDTGPGNCISDHLVRTHHPDGPGVDVDGALASTGTASQMLLDLFRGDPYFSRVGPKSTDGPAMIAMYERALERAGAKLSLEDQLATACAISAMLIADSLRPLLPDEVIVSGGGTKNRAIMKLLMSQVRPTSVKTTDELGIPSEAKEAIAFALLGAATLDNLPSNVPSCTGASRPVVLGSISRS